MSTTVAMKAARIHQWGGPEVLNVEAAEQPVPSADQVLIQVRAAGINPVDWKMRQGYMSQIPLPLILGRDAAGDVVAVGANVTTFKVGDAVYGTPGASFAEFAVAEPGMFGLKPKTLDYDQAAAVPVGALTAWRSLFDAANLQTGQRVLIHGAAGGVANFGVQLAKAFGAHVIGTGSANNEAFIRELGADEFIDYNAARFEDVIKDADVVFDTVGGETLERSYAAVKRGGVLVTIVGQPSSEKAAQHGIQALSGNARPSTATLNEIAGLIDSGKLKVHVSRVFPLDEVRQALDLIQTGHTRGKIVLHI